MVSIALNIVPHKQKVELAGELMRREEKILRNHNYAKIKTKEEVIGERKQREEI